MHLDMGCVRAGGSSPERNGAIGGEPNLSAAAWCRAGLSAYGLLD